MADPFIAHISSQPTACIAASDDARISQHAQVKILRLPDRFVGASGNGPRCRYSLAAESSDRPSLVETDSYFRRTALGCSDRAASSPNRLPASVDAFPSTYRCRALCTG